MKLKKENGETFDLSSGSWDGIDFSAGVDEVFMGIIQANALNFSLKMTMGEIKSKAKAIVAFVDGADVKLLTVETNG